MHNFFQDLLSEFKLPLESPILVMSAILIIILFSPILMEKIKAPSIIGLILAGVAIGPYGFNILGKNMFVDIFSTIGLLYIMFIAGLELDLNEFKVNRNKSLAFAFYTFIIPLGIGYPIVRYFLGYDFNASFLTAAMFATHTLVAYPIISKMGLAKNPAVAATVGGTILTDTAVLIILAVILGNSQGGLTNEFWIRFGISLVVFSVILFLVIPRLAKWFFSTFEEKKELHYIFVLSMVFFAAFFAKAAGLEPIIGAFAAGIALNKLIPASSALMNRVEFIGNSIFIPFFLISVGMLVDVGVIFHGWRAWIVAGTLMILGIGGKWLAAWVTQLSFRFSVPQRNVIFGLSCGHAAATLAVVTVGYNAGILDEVILNGTIILILIACLIASLVTESAAKKLKKETEEDAEAILKTSGAGSEQILLTVSDFGNMEKILEMAILVKDKKSDNPVSVLTVVDNTEDAEVDIAKAKEALQSFVKEGAATETPVNVLTTIDESKEEGIDRISKEISADVIMLDWPEKGFDEVRISRFLEQLNRNLFVCKFSKPMALHGKIHLMIPPESSVEQGFEWCLLKTAMLAQELSNGLNVYCTLQEENEIKKIAEKNKLTITINYSRFDDWDDFLILSKDITEDDIIIIISVRGKTFTHSPDMKIILKKLDKYFSKNSTIVIYPKSEKETPKEMEVAHEEPEVRKPGWTKLLQGYWRGKSND